MNLNKYQSTYIDATTRSLVESLLKAQGEESQ